MWLIFLKGFDCSRLLLFLAAHIYARDKWYKHAIDTIGGVTPNYNYSARTPNGEGVFLRGKWGGDYSQEFDDSFRSHNHKQQAHTHPITMNVEDGRANGGFEGQEYADFFARRKYGNTGGFSDAANPIGKQGNLTESKSYNRHLATVGGISGLQAHQVVGNEVSGFKFPIKPLKTTIRYKDGMGRCNFMTRDGIRQGHHVFQTGSADVMGGQTDLTSSSFTWGMGGRNANRKYLFDGQSTVTVEGRYEGEMIDPVVVGTIFPDGGDTSFTNQNVHYQGEVTEKETTEELETAPVNAEVMYIIKIHP